MKRWLMTGSACLLVTACLSYGSDQGCIGVVPADAGVDAGDIVDVNDAGLDAGQPSDAGVDAGVDAGNVDAGNVDAGNVDAGNLDAGVNDAGVFDAGIDDAGPVQCPEVGDDRVLLEANIHNIGFGQTVVPAGGLSWQGTGLTEDGNPDANEFRPTLEADATVALPVVTDALVARVTVRVTDGATMNINFGGLGVDLSRAGPSTTIGMEPTISGRVTRSFDHPDDTELTFELRITQPTYALLIATTGGPLIDGGELLGIASAHITVTCASEIGFAINDGVTVTSSFVVEQENDIVVWIDEFAREDGAAGGAILPPVNYVGRVPDAGPIGQPPTIDSNRLTSEDRVRIPIPSLDPLQTYVLSAHIEHEGPVGSSSELPCFGLFADQFFNAAVGCIIFDTELVRAFVGEQNSRQEGLVLDGSLMTMRMETSIVASFLQNNTTLSTASGSSATASVNNGNLGAVGGTQGLMVFSSGSSGRVYLHDIIVVQRRLTPTD